GRGTSRGRGVLLDLPVRVVNDVPTANVPFAAVQVGATMGLGAANVRVVWRSATHPTSPIVGYQVQRGGDGGAWTATIERTGTQNEAVESLAFGSGYRFRLRALDRAGNWSPWVTTPTTHVYPVDDRNTAIVRKGAWVGASSSSAYKSTVSGSTQAG